MTGTETLHANCVALAGRGLLVLGRPGAGKSTLALELMAFGATLVADDQVTLRRVAGVLRAEPARGLEGMIEARGVGLLRTPWLASAEVTLALDLDMIESQRLPQLRTRVLLGGPIAIMFRPERLNAAAVLARLRFGPPLDPQTQVPTHRPD